MKHVATVLARQEIVQLPREQLLKRLGKDDIDVDEKIVYEAVVRRGEAHKGDGTLKEAIKGMLPLIRLPAVAACALDVSLRFPERLFHRVQEHVESPAQSKRCS